MSMIIAAAFAIEVGLAFTHHTIDRPGMEDWNEVHPQVTLSYEDAFGTTDIITGVYLNSEDNASVFVGVEFDDVFIDGLNIEAGAVTGYASADVLPMVRVTYDFNENMEGFLFPIATTEVVGGECITTYNEGRFGGSCRDITDDNFAIGFGLNFKFNIR